MISLPAYDIIRTVNREVDLTRPPIREYHHTFGETAVSSHDDETGGGGGFPAARSRLAGLRSAARSLTTRGPRPLTNLMG